MIFGEKSKPYYKKAQTAGDNVDGASPAPLSVVRTIQL